MFKKTISSIVIVSLLFAQFVFYSGFKDVCKLEVNNLISEGIKLSKADYKDAYGKPLDERKELKELTSLEKVSLIIDQLVVYNDQITIEYQINGFDSSDLSGNLFKTRQKNCNNIVADLNCSDPFEVLFFEISNTYQFGNLLYNTKLEKKPYIKLYMADKDENIYLFELSLPIELYNIEIKNDDVCKEENDFTWYNKIVDPYITEKINNKSLNTVDILNLNNTIIGENIAYAAGETLQQSHFMNTCGVQIQPKGIVSMSSNCLNEIQLRASVPSYMWASDRIYEYTTYNGYLETEYRLCPYGYIRGSNVSSSDSTWSSSLEISESMINKNTVTGEEDVYHGYNQIYVDNVRISFACGNKTQMLRTFTDGKTKLVNGGDIANGKPLAGRILAKIFDAVPFGKQANEIIGWISDVSKMNTMASEIKLGSEYMTLFSKPTSGLIKTFDKKYIFNKHTEADGHSAITQVILSSSLNENERTTGVIRIMYDVQSYPSAYYDEYLRKDYTVESIFDYSSGSYK